MEYFVRELERSVVLDVIASVWTEMYKGLGNMYAMMQLWDVLISMKAY